MKTITQERFEELIETKDVSNLDLSGIDFEKFKKQTLSEIDFSGCNFGEKKDLSYIKFIDSSFERVTGVKMKLRMSTFERCSFQNAILPHSTFRRSRIYSTNFKYSDLSKNTFDEAEIKETDFEGANIREMEWFENGIDDCSFKSLTFNDDSFMRMDSSKIKLYVDRSTSRCSHAEEYFYEFTKKKIELTYQNRKIHALINYNKNERKFSLIFRKNIESNNGKIWKDCLYHVIGGKERKRIINFCNSNKKIKRINLEERVLPLRLAFTRPLIKEDIPSR